MVQQTEDYSYILLEQYVSEVLDFSSQYGSDNSISYTAHNIAGTPSKFPAYGDFSQTYVMRDYGPWWLESPSGRVWRQPYPGPRQGESNRVRGHNFIDVKYEHAVYPIQVHVYETYNPGGVVALWAGDCQGGWKLLWELCRSPGQELASQRPRIFSPPLHQTHFPTKLIRIEFNQTQLPYYTEIDAVALLGTLDPISAEAKATALLPEKPGPILERIVKQRLHILPPDPIEILENCEKQLSGPALRQFQLDMSEREKSPPPSYLGYFQLLPREIIIKIFSYLDVISLLHISSTCTKLNECAQDGHLYSTVDLRQIFYTASSNTLRWLEPRCCNMTRLDLSWCGNYGKIKPKHLQQFIECTGHVLQSLRLDNSHVATVAVLNSVVSCCNHLQDLSLSNCHLLNMPDFHIIAELENLVSLNLYRTSVAQTSIISILCNNRNIKNLNLAACPNIDGDELCIVLSHCQLKLECLDLWRCSSLTDKGLASLAACTRLRDLDIGWCLNIHVLSGALVHLTEACPDLQRLYLTAHRQTGDKELRAIAKLKRLEQLDILGNRNVSLGAVQELLASVPTLQLLDASFCEQLGEANIRNLRQNYPQVSIKWSFTDLT